jgi:cupin 2 domain-containing protein
MSEGGNLFDIPESLPAEHFTTLLASPNVRIERIVSRGHASPPDFWYDQEAPEWVMVIAGSAGIAFEGEPAPQTLNAGDHVHIPAHARHRVAWTDASQPTIWLAVHYR